MSNATHRSTFESLETRRLMSAGAVDTSFGIQPTGNAQDVAVQADGKTIVVCNSNDGDFSISRLNVNGTVDKTFGTGGGGIVFGHFGSPQLIETASSVAIQSDGKIVVAGTARQKDQDAGGYDSFMLLARYLPNGQLDRSFSADNSNAGFVMTDLGTDGWTTIPSVTTADVAIQPDGKIVVAGTATPSTLTNVNPDMFVARFQYSGLADTDFGDNGVRFVGFGANETGRAVAIDTNGTAATNPYFGTIVIAGQTSNGTSHNLAVARLTPGGDFDSRFNQIGKREIDFAGQSSSADGVVIQPGGKIVVAGYVTSTTGTDKSYFELSRFTAAGENDTTFGVRHDGSAVTRISGKDTANDIIRSNDGGLIVGGNANGTLAIAKYTADGVLDTTFGTNGIVAKTNIGGINRMALSFGKRFMVAGNFNVTRMLDTGANQITLTMQDQNAYERGQDPASFIVDRGEALPWPTRVYLKVGGTATSPLSKMPGSHADYTGITAPPLLAALPGTTGTSVGPFGSTAYVDIPAGQTFATVKITPIVDTRTEGTETATFSLINNANYEAGSNTNITLNIYDAVNFQPLVAKVTRAFHGKTMDDMFSDTAVTGA